MNMYSRLNVEVEDTRKELSKQAAAIMRGNRRRCLAGVAQRSLGRGIAFGLMTQPGGLVAVQKQAVPSGAASLRRRRVSPSAEARLSFCKASIRREASSRRDPVAATARNRQLKIASGGVQWSECAPHRVAEDRLERS